MRRTSPLFLAALLVLAACGPAPEPLAPQPPPPSEPAAPPPLAITDDPAAVARITADVALLASPALAGRGTGEPGAQLAADHVAHRFAELGLVPFGGTDARGVATWLQPFSARIGAKVAPATLARGPKGKPGKAPAIEVGTAEGSSSGEASGGAVFVGFGVTAPAVGWDDYAGQNVEGKVVVVLDGAPKSGDKPEALRDFGSSRYKIRTAREHKAAGVVLVHVGDTLPSPPADPKGMGLPAVVVTAAGAKKLFPGVRFDDKSKVAHKPAPVAGAPVTLGTRIDPVDATAWNVIGMLPARADSPHAGEVVVVGAHYDHLGHGDARFSRAPTSHEIHPGADDNASGTALMLEVARRLRALPARPDRGVLFMAFGAEEIGTIGSRWWVEHPTVKLADVVAMINADMVGRLREGKLTLDGVGTAAGWKPLVDAASAGLGLQIAFGAEGFGASDHASFTSARVPVAFLFTGAHSDYHLPSDTADKINAEGEARLATFAARLALATAQAKDRLVFVDAPADPHRGGRGGFKVSLGTMPDYAFSGKGVRLDGVRPDAPAARAGLKQGDVIVKLGAHEITNIHDYMFALGELEPGREVSIEVEREGHRVPLKVIPAPGH